MLVQDSAQTKNALFFFNERRLVCPIGGVYIYYETKDQNSVINCPDSYHAILHNRDCTRGRTIHAYKIFG